TAPFAGINTYGILSFLFLGGVTYSIGAFMFFYSLKVLNPLFAGSATYATPLLTILFSTVLLGAQLHSYYFYALLFIFLALFIQQRQANKAPRYIPGRRYEGPSVLFDVTGVFIANRSNTVSNHIQGKGRALAAVVDKEWYANVDVKLLKDANVLIFTNDNLHPDISNEEIEFMNGILMPKNNELIMVGIGEPEAIEDAFNRVYYSAET
ncbi:MAG: DMT family transporter, partial [Candidatus Micrarchaeota archaeon]|nr:DMT family transporter [Candidatus Micrarchaeota archaeon]